MNDNSRGQEERIGFLMQLTNPPLTRAQALEVDDIAIHAANEAGDRALEIIKRLPHELQIVGNWAALMAIKAKVEASIAALYMVLQVDGDDCTCPVCELRRLLESAGARVVSVDLSDIIAEEVTPPNTTKH